MSAVLSVAGLLLGVVASMVLALSLRGLISAVVLCITAFDTTLQTYFSTSPGVPVFTGLDTHLRKGVSRAKCFTAVGFALLGMSFILQTVAALVAG